MFSDTMLRNMTTEELFRHLLQEVDNPIYEILRERFNLLEQELEDIEHECHLLESRINTPKSLEPDK